MVHKKDDMLVSNEELLEILLKNPFIKTFQDDVTEKSLYKWIAKESISKLGKRSTRHDVFGLITKLSLDGFFNQNIIGKTILLKPTEKYFLLKKGETIEEVNKETSQIKSDDNKNTIQNNVGEIKFSNENTNKIPNDFSFYDLLVSNVDNHTGANKKILKYAPDFFNLLCNILNDKFTDWHTKILISSALGYFVLDDDVIPDNSENGYIDDLFIICYILKEIKNNISPDLIKNNWHSEENILELIEEIYEKSYEIVDDEACEILQKVGLHKFKTLELEEYSGTYQKRLAKVSAEKRELLALSASLIKQLYGVNLGHNFKRIKEYLQRFGDYDEINRLIELSNINHDVKVQKDENSDDFETQLEEELRQARLEALLED